MDTKQKKETDWLKGLIALILLIGLTISAISFFYNYFHATPIPEEYQASAEGKAWE